MWILLSFVFMIGVFRNVFVGSRESFKYGGMELLDFFFYVGL